MPNEVAPWEEANNLAPFDVVVPKGTDATSMAQDIKDYKITPQPLKTETAPWEDETPPWDEATKSIKPTAVAPTKKESLVDRVDKYTSQFNKDQRAIFEVPLTLGTGLVSLIPSVGSMLIPTPERLKEIKEGKNAGIVTEINRRLERAKQISGLFTYEPKSQQAQKILEPVNKVMGFLPEKAAEAIPFYNKLAEEYHAKGDDKTATFYKTLADILPISSEAANFYVLGKTGEALRIVKKVTDKAVKPPTVEGLPTEQGKPYSITPDVSAELKSLKGETPKVEVKETANEVAPEIKSEEPISSVEKVEPKPTLQAEKQIEQVKIDAKPAKAALDINQDLIDKGYEGLPEKDLASYNPMRAKEEVAKVLEYADREDFYDMAKGNKPMPEDVHPQILFNMAVDKATKAGDINTIMDLAKSPIAEQRSVAAQTLRMSQEGKPTNNVVTKIQEVKKSWESKIKDEKVAQRSRKTLFEEVKKTNIPKEDLVWEKFLKSIEC